MYKNVDAVKLVLEQDEVRAQLSEGELTNVSVAQIKHAKPTPGIARTFEVNYSYTAGSEASPRTCAGTAYVEMKIVENEIPGSGAVITTSQLALQSLISPTCTTNP